MRVCVECVLEGYVSWFGAGKVMHVCAVNVMRVCVWCVWVLERLCMPVRGACAEKVMRLRLVRDAGKFTRVWCVC